MAKDPTRMDYHEWRTTPAWQTWDRWAVEHGLGPIGSNARELLTTRSELWQHWQDPAFWKTLEKRLLLRTLERS